MRVCQKQLIERERILKIIIFIAFPAQFISKKSDVKKGVSDCKFQRKLNLILKLAQTFIYHKSGNYEIQFFIFVMGKTCYES